MQQGDPLGPLFFVLALQPVLQELASQRSVRQLGQADSSGLELVFSYLDDCCLARDYRAVATALSTLQDSCSRIGLSLSIDLCEVIPAAGHDSTLDPELFPEDILIC